MPQQPTARARIERAFHVSFKLPEQAAELLDDYRDEVLTEAATIARANCHLQPGQCGCHTAADHILNARTTKES